MNLINKVVNQADAYRAAMTNSIETAEDGVAFAEDALRLCTALAGNVEPAENLMTFVDSMLEIANKSYDAARRTNEEFRAIRVEIGKASHTLALSNSASYHGFRSVPSVL